MVVKFAGLEGIGGRLRTKFGEIANFSSLLGGEAVWVESGRGVSGCEIDISLEMKNLRLRFRTINEKQKSRGEIISLYSRIKRRKYKRYKRLTLVVKVVKQARQF